MCVKWKHAGGMVGWVINAEETKGEKKYGLSVFRLW